MSDELSHKCPHGDPNCGLYWNCDKCSGKEQREKYRLLKPEQKVIANLRAQLDAVTRERDEAREKIEKVIENATRVLITGTCDKHREQVCRESFADFCEHPRCMLCLEVERDEARQQLAAQEAWQPIETAPRDASSFIAGYPGKNGVGEAYYDTVVKGFRDARTTELIAPTHWQPLPAPPSPQQ